MKYSKRFTPKRPKFYKKYKTCYAIRLKFIPEVVVEEESNLIWDEPGYSPIYPLFDLSYSQEKYFWGKMNLLQGIDSATLRCYDCPLPYLRHACVLAPHWAAVAYYLKKKKFLSHLVFIPWLCGHGLLYQSWIWPEQKLMNKGLKRAFDLIYVIWKGRALRKQCNTWVPMALASVTVQKNDRMWAAKHPNSTHTSILRATPVRVPTPHFISQFLPKLEIRTPNGWVVQSRQARLFLSPWG